VVKQSSPAVWRVTQAPNFDGFICQTSFVKVIKGFIARRSREHLLTVEAGSFLENNAEVLPGFSIGLGFGGMLDEGDASAFSQIAQGFVEIPAFALHHVAKNISAFVALSEAAPGLRLRENHKRGGTGVAVERAKTNIVFTSTPQFDRLTYDFNDVEAIFDVIYNSHHLLQVIGVVQGSRLGCYTTPP